MEYCLRRDEGLETELQIEESVSEERAVLCAACGHEITRAGEKIRIRGEFEHRFTNPYGYMFRIGCFGKAEGCGSVGMPTEEFTWFPGYAWQYTFCARCRVHLGWRFIGIGENDGGFYGLILDRLTEPV